MEKFRIGHGYDIHRLETDRKLILGGIEIPFEKGLLGHSDADVLTHAVMDALLGALALGDIGKYFPPDDKKYKDACSIELLKEVLKLIKNSSYEIANIDATVLAEKPKLLPFIDEIRAKLSETTGIDKNNISVKATTNEGLDAVGEGKAISCHCVVLLKQI